MPVYPTAYRLGKQDEGAEEKDVDEGEDYYSPVAIIMTIYIASSAPVVYQSYF